MPAAMDQVDCACPEATRTKGEGQACTSARRVRARLHLQPDGRRPDLPPDLPLRRERRGRLHRDPNDCPTAGTTCRAVTNNTIYGICLLIRRRKAPPRPRPRPSTAWW